MSHNVTPSVLFGFLLRLSPSKISITVTRPLIIWPGVPYGLLAKQYSIAGPTNLSWPQVLPAAYSLLNGSIVASDPPAIPRSSSITVTLAAACCWNDGVACSQRLATVRSTLAGHGSFRSSNAIGRPAPSSILASLQELYFEMTAPTAAGQTLTC